MTILPQSDVSTSDPSRFITAIFVEESCADLPYTREILGRANNVPVQILPERTSPAFDYPPYPASLGLGKQHLLLCRNRGRFFKPCPATRVYRCCDYQVLNTGMNCPMDCTYCILQAYLNNPWLSLFVNTDDLFRELTEAFRREPERFWRIGTGEFTDSMALDRLTGLSRLLVTFMRTQANAVLELKSKAVVLDHLKDLDHGGRTIMAWSMNSATIMRQHEHKTAPLADRLAAAAQCAAWGYPLAFHFDPLIFYPGWEEEYRQTIRAIYHAVPADRIAWISLGAFRFLPQLKTIIATRFPHARFAHEEFITGLDNKCRYFRSQRTAMYRALVEELRHHAHPATCLYLCMESETIWQEVFGFVPEEHGGLGTMLDAAARRFAGNTR